MSKNKLQNEASPIAIVIADPPKAEVKRPPRRVRRALESGRKPRLYYSLAPKGGVGKSFTARALVDLLMALRMPVRAVQVDRGTSLTAYYPELTKVIHVPSSEELRAAPLAGITAFQILEEEVEKCVELGADLVVDVGAALNAKAFLDFAARARFDARLKALSVDAVALLLFVAESSAMGQSADLADVMRTVHPSAEIVPCLNERDGRFSSLRPGTTAHRLWTDRVAPLVAANRNVVIPAMAAGAWSVLEGHDLSFALIAEADERELAARIGDSRAIAATLAGDVSEWLDAVWSGLKPIVTESIVTEATEDDNAAASR